MFRFIQNHRSNSLVFALILETVGLETFDMNKRKPSFPLWLSTIFLLLSLKSILFKLNSFNFLWIIFPAVFVSCLTVIFRSFLSENSDSQRLFQLRDTFSLCLLETVWTADWIFLPNSVEEFNRKILGHVILSQCYALQRTQTIQRATWVHLCFWKTICLK